ncbi:MULTISPECIES: NAD(P)/FAD-dependent oxidoreductase [unclassified Micromonospora]|uniref:NAD(P)/FAD-dependent oxidoreductase n=1 Tax=unclassified Micromonospora TaxID=2617518 RepID=UPI001B377485|nr:MULTISPECIES: FAD-dependent oxidoreductase [unclassified Micromonospora]MBQ1043259.1 FAD-dependent oxidoreductase [Micromonospora sp. C72]MBQ1056520.1 FAD-dependent oxidoreductase [Micromonospora sp. C32]
MPAAAYDHLVTADRAGVVVVGAGIAGVACATELARAGIPVRVRERARVTGGRMASKRFDGRPADLGAAYFTVDDPDFAAVVDRWRDAGLAREWTDTLVAYGPRGREQVSGPMRWAAPRGLRSLVEHLAGDLPVTHDRLVMTVEPGPRVDGTEAEAVVLAMPGPQAALLLDPALAEATRAVAAQRWSSALTGVLRFPARRWADFRGAFVNEHPVLSLVCDDGDRRGDGAPVLVAHTTAGFAAGHLLQPTGAREAVEQAVRDLLGLPDPAVSTHVHRWTYATPAARADGPGFHLDDDGIGLAGDAFGRPRVQTAWRSGRDLGRALAARLG